MANKGLTEKSCSNAQIDINVIAETAMLSAECEERVTLSLKTLISTVDFALDTAKNKINSSVDNNQFDAINALSAYCQQAECIKKIACELLNSISGNLQKNVRASGENNAKKALPKSIDGFAIRKTPHYLDEKLVQMKVCAFKFDGEYYGIKGGWPEVISVFCSQLAKRDKQKFQTLLYNPDFKGESVYFFTKTPNGRENRLIPGTDIYVYTHYNNRRLQRKLLDLLFYFGYMEKDFEYYVDPYASSVKKKK